MPVYPYSSFNERLLDALRGQTARLRRRRTHYSPGLRLGVWRHRPGGAPRVLHGRTLGPHRKETALPPPTER
jgi:hypothetical protein